MQVKGQNAVIRYGLGECLLGRLLVARTEVGLCAVALGDTEEALLGELRARFPRARSITAAPDGLREEVAAVLRHLDAQRSGDGQGAVPPGPAHGQPEMALDLAGTPFEQRVWAAMCRIPAGQTMEYGRFAAELGYPQGARAVGAAIGKNPLALLYPCHRLVAKGGGLHRYRWGVERKRQLLSLEGGALPADDGNRQGTLTWTAPGTGVTDAR